jgi:hypothetical protein
MNTRAKPMRHPEYRHELDGLDPVTLIIAPLIVLMLSIMIIRAIVAASVV